VAQIAVDQCDEQKQGQAEPKGEDNRRRGRIGAVDGLDRIAQYRIRRQRKELESALQYKGRKAQEREGGDDPDRIPENDLWATRVDEGHDHDAGKSKEQRQDQGRLEDVVPLAAFLGRRSERAEKDR